MIDLKNVEKYRENNRIEAKKALGGLPGSIWETYSAFANTLGGVILLGVEEYKDKTFHVVDLPNPEGMIEKFKSMLSDRKIASSNILSDGDITIEHYGGKRFIAINVPRAHRFDKPIYIDGNIYGGTYRRGGEGDYRCTKEEINSMIRDAETVSSDMIMLSGINIDSLKDDTIGKYVEHLRSTRPSGFEYGIIEELLAQIGAVKREDDAGKYHPNAAGLLMFGKKHDILKFYPNFSAMLIEKNDSGDIIYSSDFENLFEFYLEAERRITRSVCLIGMNRKEETAVCAAIKEALANSIIHADYHGKAGLCAEISPFSVALTNPGSLRISPTTILSGAASDRRNALIAKILYLLGIGSGGVKGIYEVWLRKKWCAPLLSESFSPDRVMLTLIFGKSLGVIDSFDRETPNRREAVISYITDNIEASSSDIASLLGIGRDGALSIMKKLADEQILTYEKRGNIYYYRLKS